MKFTFVGNPNASHLVHILPKLIEGLRRLGHTVDADISRPGRPSFSSPTADAFICWGERMRKKLEQYNRPTLVMEMGFVGSRTWWTYMGWDGLNGRGRQFIPDDGGLRADGIGIRPNVPKLRSGYALVFGQVPGDTTLSDGSMWDINKWLGTQASLHGSVKFREHPHAGSEMRWCQHLARTKGSLNGDLRGASHAIAWSSNALTDARLYGITVTAGSPFAMTYPVRGDVSVLTVRNWADALAWTQFQPKDFENDDTVRIILDGAFKGQVWHERDFSLADQSSS